MSFGDKHPRAWAIILAAGAATRFGSAKALAHFENTPLITHIQKLAGKVLDNRVKVVLGAKRDELAPLVAKDQIVFNEHWEDGMGSSLATGVRAVLAADRSAEAVLILLVDQPLINVSHLENLLDAAAESHLCQFTLGDGITGPPAVLTSAMFARALKVEGDKGLKSGLRDDEYQTLSAPFAHLDIDTESDLGRLRGLIKKA